MTEEELAVRFNSFFFILFVFTFTAYILYIVHSTEPGARPDLGLSFLSPRVYIVTTLEDGSGIWTYSFRNAVALSPKRPTHVATLHLPLLHDHRRTLLELTTTTSPFLARPPAQVPFATAYDACTQVFTLSHDPTAHNQTLIRHLDGHQEEVGTVNVRWKE